MRNLKRLYLYVVICALALTGRSHISGQVTLDSGSKSFLYHHTDGSGNSHYYSYAPSVVLDGSTEYIYTCHNSQADQVQDNVWLTEINTTNGQTIFDRPVLAPTNGAWDSWHTCDPSVIRSTISYDGTAYSYLMFYLGTDQPDNNHNQIGLAVANTPEGPWIKYPYPVVGYNPSIPGCSNNGTNSCWGAGQPTVTSVDGTGRVLLFISGSGGAGRGDLDVSNLSSSSPNFVFKSFTAVTSAGLTDLKESSDWLNNYDVVYDGSRDRFYAVREQHDNSINYCSPSYPDYICQSLQIVSIDGASIWNGGGSWRVEANISPSFTGYPRNHNAGVVRNWWGSAVDPNNVTTVYTVSCAEGTGTPCNGTGSTADWTYSLWQVKGRVQ